MNHMSMRRIIAWVLCILLFLTSMPLGVLAEEIGATDPRRQTSMPVMMPKLGAAPVMTALEYFNSRSDTLVALNVMAITDDVGNVQNAELIGKPFKYKVQLTFAAREAETWEYKDNNATVPLVKKYENVTLWIKAPAGIVLIDDSGEPLPLDADGYYKTTLPDVYPAAKDSTVVPYEVTAVMLGNGSTPSKDYGAALAKFSATVKLPTTYAEPDEEWETKEGDGEIGKVETPNAQSDNSSATHGVGEAKWAVLKTEEGQAAVTEDGKNVRVNYIIEAGRNIGTDERPVIPDGNDNYARYGMLDLNDDAYIVDIAPIVNDKNNNPVAPSKVTIQIEGKDTAMREVSLDANNSYTIPASDFATVSGEDFGMEGDVKAKTVIHVCVYYPADNFTYSIVDGKDKDEDAFDFTNTAKLSYSLKGVGTVVNKTDDATVRWCAIAPGGNVQVSEYLAPGTGSRRVPYNYVHRQNLGTPSYTITRCDKDGNALPGDTWSMQLTFDAENRTHTIVTGNPDALADDGKYVIPIGYVKITADYSAIAGIADGDVNAVDGDGNVITAYTSGPIEIKEKETAEVDFFLKYVDGGFLNFTKHYYDADGQQITAADKIGDLAKNTSFTLTKLDEPSRGKVYRFTLDSDATWSLPIKAGSYSVTEKAPSGYHPASIDNVIIASGETKDVNNGVIENHYSKVTIKAAAFSTDMFAEGKLQGTLDTADAFTDADLKYEVYDAAGTMVGELTTDNGYSCEVDRYDENGALNEYYLVDASGTLPKALYGSVDGTTMTKGETSASFKFESNSDLTHTVNWYYQNIMKVTVVMTVVDSRDSTHKASANGWKFELKQGDVTVETGETAKVGGTNGVIEFTTALPLTDETGAYCTYSVNELGPGTEPLDTALFDVTYTPRSITASHANKDQTVQFTVNNTAKVGYLKLTKQDYEKSSTKLNGAKYVIYYLDGETPMYIMDRPLNDQGLRKASPYIEDALVCVTGEDGTGYFNLDYLSCAYTYYAQEIEAPADYTLESAPVKIGTLKPYDSTSSSTKSKTLTSVTIKDVKLPQLTITKTSVDENGNNMAVSTAGLVMFQVYVQDPENSDKIVKLTNADGSNCVVQVDIAAGSASGSAVITLPGAGKYFLKETNSSFNLILPENGAAKKQTFVEKYEGDTLVEYLIEVPEVKAYTGTASSKKQHKVTVTARDVNNEAELVITKYDNTSGKILTAYDGQYCIAAYVPVSDIGLKTDLSSRGWQLSAATADLPAVSGYEIYVSPTVSTSAGEYKTAIPGRDFSGRAITYKIVELVAPKHYYNKGTSFDEHNVAEATHNNPCTQYAAHLYNIKAIEVDLSMYLKKMYEYDDGCDTLRSGVAPFEFSIYEVNGDKLTLKATTTVSGSTAKFTLDKVHLDTTKEHYIVETDSCGYDTRMDADMPGRTDGRVKVSPSAITKVSDITGTFDAGSSYGTVKLNSYKIGAAQWADYKTRNDEDGTYYITTDRDLMNYDPYFQIVLPKAASTDPVDPAHSVVDENVDKCKFKMYKIPAKDYKDDPKAAVYGGATTDNYIYETGTYSPGEFITEWLDYYADYVYIFVEQVDDMPNGLRPIEKYVYTAVTPAMYKNAKNGIYRADDVYNQVVTKDGYAYDCYVQILLDKFIDEDCSMNYSEGVDKALAGVQFEAQLIDKYGNTVDCEELTTFFTTGVDTTKPSFGISETMHVTPDLFAGLKARGFDVNDIFSFKCEGEPRKYDSSNPDDITFVKEAMMPIFDEQGRQIGVRGSLYTVSFNMLLTEKSYCGVPLTNVNGGTSATVDFVPIKTSYTISFMDVPGGGTAQNKDHIEENAPILNIKGKGVLMRPVKLDANGKAWTPADANDKVVFKIYAADFDDPAWNDPDYAAFKEYEITLNQKNYNNIPVIQLKPDTLYYINEVTSPKMYDKPNGDVDTECSGGAFKTFKSAALSSRLESKEEDRIQTVAISDPGYQTITVKKLDSKGNPVAGKKFRLEYTAASGTLSATEIFDANDCLIVPTAAYVTNLDEGRMIETDFVGVTDANGVVSFTVPVYDNRTVTSVSAGSKTSTLCSTPASYRVQELDDNYNVVSTFNVINEKESSTGIVSVSKGVNTVVNTETGKLIISKPGVTEDDSLVAPTPVEGVKFELSYAPFRNIGQMTAQPTGAYVSSLGTGSEYPDWTTLGSYNTDGNGLITLTGCASGFYKIVETVPTGYVNAGKTNTIYIAYITPADRLSLAQINKTAAYGPVLVIETDTEKATMTVGGKTYAIFEADTAATDPTLKVRSVRKGYLDITTTFIENQVGIAAPGSVKVGVKDASGQKVGEEKTITITNGAGEIAAYYELDPGTYTVYEITEGAWHGKGIVEGDTSADAGVLPETEREICLANVVVKPSNIVADPAGKTEGDREVRVSFTNVNAVMHFDGVKYDSENELVPNAQFVVFNGNDGTYYKGTIGEDGYGEWTTSLDEAKRYVTNSSGTLSIDFVAAKSAVEAMTDIADEKTAYTFREVEVEDAEFLSLVNFTHEFALGESYTAAKEELLDKRGFKLEFTLYGRTLENIAAGGDKPTVDGASFTLYKVGADGKAAPVSAIDQTYRNVTLEGEGYYYHLDPLEENESYFLVQNGPTEGYRDLYPNAEGSNHAYIAAEMGAGALPLETADGKKGFTVISYGDEVPQDCTYRIRLYNEPMSRLLILKYNDQDPKTEDAAKIPVGAKFVITPAETNGGQKKSTVTVSLTDVPTEKTVELAKALGIEFDSYFADDLANYSFAEIDKDIAPGTYTITESMTSEDTEYAAKWLLTPDARESDPWYPVRTVKIDNDGGLNVVRFSNIPYPDADDLNFEKEIIAVNGEADGKLGNAQCGYQTLKFNISDFAPCADENGEIPSYIAYSVKSLSLTDDGLRFYAASTQSESGLETVVNVDSYVIDVTVGKAYYDTEGTVYADVYGVNNGSKTLVKSGIALTEAQTVTFPARTYGSFEIDYYDPTVSNGLKKHFKAEAVQVTMEYMQKKDDPTEGIVTKVDNLATVKMSYDVGETSPVEIIGTAEVSIPADDTIQAPTASLTETVSILQPDGTWSTQTGGTETVNIMPDDIVCYVLVFKNTTDAEDIPEGMTAEDFAIPMPFIADEMPACIDIGATIEGKMYVASFTTDDAALRSCLGSVVAERDKVITVTHDGVEHKVHPVYALTDAGGKLMPGKSLTLTIYGTVNAAKVMDEAGRGIVNVGFGGSADNESAPKNKLNADGVPFLDDGHAMPGSFSGIETVKSYAALTADITHTVRSESGIIITKAVAGEYTGFDNWMSGDSDTAITWANGRILYKISFSSKTSIPAGQFRIADILPVNNRNGDKSIGGADRRSAMKTLGLYNFKLYKNGELMESNCYTLHTSDNSNQSYYKGVLETDKNTSIPNSKVSNDAARGFVLQIDEDVIGTDESLPGSETGDVFTVTFECRAPAGIEHSAAGYSYNYYKIAINDVMAWSPMGPHETVIEEPSNRCRVTILPEETAQIGDRIWLDVNANGIQDSGEPDFSTANGFPEINGITLRTFKNSNTVFCDGAAQSAATGHYTFDGLTTEVADPDKTVYSSGHAMQTALNGDLRTLYQVIIRKAAIPDGYMVTNAYAGNKGEPTVFRYAIAPENATDILPGMQYYVSNDSDGHEMDSDFVLVGEEYVTRRVYLPYAKINTKDDGLPNASYMNFDLGLIRYRNLEITKAGANGETDIDGATFEIYGPYETEAAAKTGYKATGATPMATVTSESDDTGKVAARFVSTTDKFINYYGYYVIVEKNSGRNYLSKNIINFSADSGHVTKLDETALLLKPGTDSEDTILEKISVTDEYVASGEMSITGEKALTDAEGTDHITEKPFCDGMFSFTLKSVRMEAKEGSDINYAFDENFASGVNFVNAADAIALSASYNHVLPLPTGAAEVVYPATYVYELSENDIVADGEEEIEAISKDTTVYTITNLVTDDGTGKLDVATTITKADGSTVGTAAFDNTYNGNDLSFSKTIAGRPKTENDEFVFTVTVTPEADSKVMKKVLAEHAFALQVTGKTDSTITFGDDLTATVTLKNGETATIADLPKNSGYTVTEADYTADGYLTTVDGTAGFTATGTIGDAAGTHAFVNTCDAGDLKITKELAGSAAKLDKEFELTVTLSRTDNVKLEGTYATAEGGTVTFAKNNGVVTGTVKLTPADVGTDGAASVTILSIPANTVFTVAETVDHSDIGFIKGEAVTGGTTIVKDTTATASVVNTRNAGSLKLSKLVTLSGGAVARRSEFTFDVVLSYPKTKYPSLDLSKDDSKPVAVIAEGSSDAVSDPMVGSTADAWTLTYTVTLNATAEASAAVTLNRILEGATYTVTERDYKSDGFNKLKINGVESSTRVATGTIGADAVEVEYTNIREGGSISVSKALDGNATDADKTFEFIVSLTAPAGGSLPASYPYEKGSETGSLPVTDGKLTFTIKGGETMTVKGILDGTLYSVTEKNYNADGYAKAIVNGQEIDTGNEGTYLTGATGSVAALESKTVAYTNVRNAGALKVSNVLSGNGSGTNFEQKRAFAFEITLTGPKGVNMKGDYATKEGSALDSVTFGSMTERDGKQTVKANIELIGGEFVEIIDIPVGTVFNVTETDYKNLGYVTSWDGLTGDKTIVAGTTSEVKATNERHIGSLDLTKKFEGTGEEIIIVYCMDVVFTYPGDIDLNQATNQPYLNGNKVGVVNASQHTVTFSDVSIASYETKVFTNLLNGAAYSVTENNYNSDGYQQTKIKNDMAAEETRDNCNEPTDRLTPVKGTITVGEDEKKTVFAVDYTNVRNVGSLKVAKAISGNGSATDFEDGRAFAFEITLTGPKGVDMARRPYNTAEGSALESVTFGSKTVDEDGRQTVKANIELMGGQYVEITDIPVGTVFNVTETDYKNIGYATSWEGLTGDKTIANGEISKVTATNERHIGELDLTKKIEGTCKKLYDNYSFKVVFTYPGDIDLSKATNLPYLGDSTGTVNTFQHTVTFPNVSVSRDGTPVVFENLLNGTAYSVTEKNYNADGYRQTKIVNDGTEQTLDNSTEPADWLTPVEGTITVGKDEKKTVFAVDYTNVCNIGALKVSKVLSGNGSETDFEDGRAFAFEITLTGPKGVNMEGAYETAEGSALDSVTFGSMTEKDGRQTVKANIELIGGENVEIIGIPEGTVFNVTETDYKGLGYATSWEGLTGDKTIVTGAVSEVTATNERHIGELDLTKAFEGTGKELYENYSFKVVFTYPGDVDLSKATNLPYLNGETGTVDTNAHTVTFSSVSVNSDGTPAVFTNLLSGTAYSVTEKNYNADGYRQTKIVNDGAAEQTIDNSTQPDYLTPVTGTITVDADEAKTVYTVKYTNVRNAGTLDVTKTVTGSGNDLHTEDGYAFKAVLTYEAYIDLTRNENLPIAKVGKTEVTGVVDGRNVTFTANLKASEILAITNILTGTTYVVTEDEETYAAEGYTTTKTGEKGTLSDDNLEAKSEFINNRDAQPLSVTKALTGNATDPDKSFSFTVTLSREDGLKVTGVYDAVLTDANGAATDKQIEFKAIEEGNEAKATASFTLKGSETMKMEDILIGTTYTVHEDDYQNDGYLTVGNDAAGNIVDGGSKETVTNSRDVAEFSIAKVLGGNAPIAGESFTFTVTLSRNDRLPVYGDYNTNHGVVSFLQNGEENSATATITIRGGETLIISDVYVGTDYTVTEANYTHEGYTTTATGATGTIAPADTQAVFTNTRNAGTLTVSNTVVAVGMGIPTDRVFTFTINLKGPNGADYSGTLHTADGSTVAFTGGKANISLKHGESLTLTDILTGSAYSVSEKVYKDCVTTSTGASGTIGTSDSQAAFTNVIRQTKGEMTINVVWDDDNNADNVRMSSVSVCVSTQFGIVGTYELNEANDWSATLTDLPKYTDDGVLLKYGVAEIDVPDGYRAFYSAKGNTITVRNRHRSIRIGEGGITIDVLDFPLCGGMGKECCFE